MVEKKGQTVLLTVIGLATLLVTLVGATFAYFTATVKDENPTNQDVVITAASLGTITYSHGNTISLDNAYPGATQNIDFTVKSAEGASAAVDYEVYMVVTSNTFETDNLVATLTAPGSGKLEDTFKANTSLNKAVFATDADGVEYKIASGTLAAGATDEWNLAVLLKEIGAEQNADQGKVFTARIEVRVQGEGEYTQQSVYGTK